MLAPLRQPLAVILSFLLAVPVFSNTNSQLGTDTYDYDAFGNLIHSTGTTYNNYLFAGEQFDPDLNLYYNRARYLNVTTGRFWSMDTFEGDPQSPLSLHKYLYVIDDPVNRIDPNGKETLGELIQSAAIYVQNVASSARAAFAAGGAAIGLFFNSIGAYTQNIGRQVIELFARINTEVVSEEVEEEVPVIFQGTRRVIDFYVQSKDGLRSLLIEAKYSLPRGGEALSRLVGQVTNSIGSGRASQVVVWTLREPTIRQTQNVINVLGGLATQVQFVHGVEGLYRYLELYFGF
jgi:RHS repeat-associated protein